MKAELAAARRTLVSYRGTSVGTQAYVVGRLVVAPLRALRAETDLIDGDLLSLGCGLGVVERSLAATNPSLRIEGVDLDAAKVDLVSATATSSPRVSLRQGDATTLEGGGTFDAVLVCDLMHHLDTDGQQALAAVAVASLRPGGTCLVKDLDVAPHWKHEWNRHHDRLVAGPDPILCRPPGAMADLFVDAGLDLEQSDRIDRPWTPYAHYLLRLRRPG
ncbi:class I SAM-dependent methyltransferase [Actinospongicola halichondriae]|uniref:class I SAM-dependent methyltransferase n=1 Tax=Actinospongicola halichondriae TaxID=3236844 RepID=UPI003D555C84